MLDPEWYVLSDFVDVEPVFLPEPLDDDVVLVPDDVVGQAHMVQLIDDDVVVD